jgi:hypothetical protein
MYVILQPHSNTNPSENHRVVWNTDWQNFVNGAASSYAFTDFPSHADAQKVVNDLNAAYKESAV